MQRSTVLTAALSPAELQHEAQKLGRMFHSIDLGDGYWTDGLKTRERMEFELAAWQFPSDLHGKTVLDIGCADGGWSAAALRRGARSVLSIDERMTGGMQFLLANRVFPLEFRQMDLFSAEFADLPVFDLVLFTGVLYHVQHPLEALKRVRSKTGERAILESHINESLGTTAPYMVYYETNDLAADDPTNWWGPNTLCLEAMLRTAGFHATKVFQETESARNARVCYHLVPDDTSLYSDILRSATLSHGVLEEYRQAIERLERRVRDLQQQLAGPPLADRPGSWLGRRLARIGQAFGRNRPT